MGLPSHSLATVINTLKQEGTRRYFVRKEGRVKTKSRGANGLGQRLEGKIEVTMSLKSGREAGKKVTHKE